MVVKIPLKNRNGDIINYSLIDDDDKEAVEKFKWHIKNMQWVGLKIVAKYLNKI